MKLPLIAFEHEELMKLLEEAFKAGRSKDNSYIAISDVWAYRNAREWYKVYKEKEMNKNGRKR